MLIRLPQHYHIAVTMSLQPCNNLVCMYSMLYYDLYFVEAEPKLILYNRYTPDQKMETLL